MIVRSLHQLWIGSKPLPERDASWCFRMKTMNPTWEWRLWGNELLEKYGQDPYVKALLAKDEKLAFVADRLRVLLLRDYGGVYLDCDCQAVKPLDSLKFWDRLDLDFVYGLRSPSREGVAIYRGVALCDNTFMASAPNGRMIQKLLDLWKPESPLVSGHRTGLQILSHTNENCIALNFRSFYDMQVGPETICLHDCHNAGTWVDKNTPRLVVPAETHFVANA